MAVYGSESIGIASFVRKNNSIGLKTILGRILKNFFLARTPYGIEIRHPYPRKRSLNTWGSLQSEPQGLKIPAPYCGPTFVSK